MSLLPEGHPHPSFWVSTETDRCGPERWADLSTWGTLTHRDTAVVLKPVVLLGVHEFVYLLLTDLLLVDTQSQESQAVLVVVGDGVAFVLEA